MITHAPDPIPTNHPLNHLYRVTARHRDGPRHCLNTNDRQEALDEQRRLHATPGWREIQFHDFTKGLRA